VGFLATQKLPLYKTENYTRQSSHRVNETFLFNCFRDLAKPVRLLEEAVFLESDHKIGCGRPPLTFVLQRPAIRDDLLGVGQGACSLEGRNYAGDLRRGSLNGNQGACLRSDRCLRHISVISVKTIDYYCNDREPWMSNPAIPPFALWG